MYLELSHSILLTTYRSRNFPIPSPFTSRLRFDIANSIHHSSFSRPGESTNISPLMNNHGQLTRPVFHFQALVYRDGNLVSGSLEALVQHMVTTEEYYPDRAYLFAFLLSARLFIKPHELLGEVCALCEHQQNLNGEGGKVRPHESSPTNPPRPPPQKPPTRAFRACTLRPPRALSFHRLEAGSTPFSHSPPRRISLARPGSRCNNEHAYPGQKCLPAKWISISTIFPLPIRCFFVWQYPLWFYICVCVCIYFFSRLIFVGRVGNIW